MRYLESFLNNRVFMNEGTHNNIWVLDNRIRQEKKEGHLKFE